jgi:nicotinate-nucleotide adenylyltransferase
MGRRTGILGGTFDPIHVGHLVVATEAARALALDQVLLLPSRTPPHRPVDPSASVFHRFAMVALAASTDARLVASDLELLRQGPSYTADALRMLHAAGHEAWQLFFLAGADAFAEIATWRDYPAVLDLAHFVVCSRPGTPATSLPARLPDLARRMLPANMASGHPGAPFDFAQGREASGLHETGAKTRIFLLDCPTPDVSSTDIRARARAGRPLAGLVLPEVDHYIRRHGLYGASSGAAAAGRPAAGNLHE